MFLLNKISESESESYRNKLEQPELLQKKLKDDMLK